MNKKSPETKAELREVLSLSENSSTYIRQLLGQTLDSTSNQGISNLPNKETISEKINEVRNIVSGLDYLKIRSIIGIALERAKTDPDWTRYIAPALLNTGVFDKKNEEDKEYVKGLLTDAIERDKGGIYWIEYVVYIVPALLNTGVFDKKNEEDKEYVKGLLTDAIEKFKDNITWARYVILALLNTGVFDKENEKDKKYVRGLLIDAFERAKDYPPGAGYTVSALINTGIIDKSEIKNEFKLLLTVAFNKAKDDYDGTQVVSALLNTGVLGKEDKEYVQGLLADAFNKAKNNNYWARHIVPALINTGVIDKSEIKNEFKLLLTDAFNKAKDDYDGAQVVSVLINTGVIDKSEIKNEFKLLLTDAFNKAKDDYDLARYIVPTLINTGVFDKGNEEDKKYVRGLLIDAFERAKDDHFIGAGYIVPALINTGVIDKSEIKNEFKLLLTKALKKTKNDYNWAQVVSALINTGVIDKSEIKNEFKLLLTKALKKDNHYGTQVISELLNAGVYPTKEDYSNGKIGFNNIQEKYSENIRLYHEIFDYIDRDLSVIPFLEKIFVSETDLKIVLKLIKYFTDDKHKKIIVENIDNICFPFEEKSIYLKTFGSFLESGELDNSDNVGDFPITKSNFLDHLNNGELLFIIEKDKGFTGKPIPWTKEWFNKDKKHLTYLNSKTLKEIKKVGIYVYELALSIGINSPEEFDILESLLNEKILSVDNYKPLLPEYKKGIKVLDKKLFEYFVNAKESHQEKEFFVRVNSLMEGVISSGKEDSSTHEDELYQEIISIVYQNNAGNYGKRDTVNKMRDNSNHLDGLKIDRVYVLDTGESVNIQVKEGKIIDTEKFNSLKGKFYSWSERFQGVGFNKEKMQNQVNEEIETFLRSTNISIEGIDIDSLNTEQKLFLLISRSIYDQRFDLDKLKEIIIGYEFAFYENIQEYINGTNDRVSGANNKDYAYLSELHTFFADRVKDIFKKIIEKANKNGFVDNQLKMLFKLVHKFETSQEKQDQINRLNPEVLLDIGRFRQQISKTLKGQGGLKAAKGMVSQRRNRIANLAKLIGNEQYLDAKNIRLGSISDKEFMGSKEQIIEGRFDSNSFQKYLSQKFIDTFSSEVFQIEEELNKFEVVTTRIKTIKGEGGDDKKEIQESESVQIKKLNAYITKNKSSAHARMVGGVCVSSDEEQWDDKSYLQMVFQDPDNLKCQGLVLMHIWEQDGEKHLIISPNPSSTYLYTVDEKALFDSIFKCLQKFATKNSIDIIGFSTNKNIRTNRTGGMFEKAMNQAVNDGKQKYWEKSGVKFEPGRMFSKSPNYNVDSVDIIWRKENK